MDVYEELKKDREQAIKEIKKAYESMAERMIEETLMPAFKKAHEKGRINYFVQICVFANPNNYVVIPMPYNTDTIEEFVYPEVEKVTVIDTEMIWNTVKDKTEKYHFENLVNVKRVGGDSVACMFSMDLT